MNTADALDLGARIADAYGERLVTTGFAVTLAAYILRFPEDVASRVVDRWIATHEFPPRISELLAELRDAMPVDPAGDAFWQRVSELLADPSAQRPDEDPGVLAEVASQRAAHDRRSPRDAARDFSSPDRVARNRRAIAQDLRRLGLAGGAPRIEGPTGDRA